MLRLTNAGGDCDGWMVLLRALDPYHSLIALPRLIHSHAWIRGAYLAIWEATWVVSCFVVSSVRSSSDRCFVGVVAFCLPLAGWGVGGTFGFPFCIHSGRRGGCVLLLTVYLHILLHYSTGAISFSVTGYSWGRSCRLSGHGC